MTEDCRIEWQDECVTLVITRPEKRNAITVAILDGLEACCDALDEGRGRALVVSAEGDRAFSSGTDLAESASLGAEASAAKGVRARELFSRLHRSTWTSIAAVNGLAYGGGMELAMACTFRVAAPTARFALPEVKIGVIPAYAGTQLLPLLVGPARALDLMLTGRTLELDEARSWGLVDRVASDLESLRPEAEALAGVILGHSQFAIDRIRRCVAGADATLSDAGLAIERAAVDEVMTSEDAREGAIAFLQKRTPKFVHR